MCLFHYISRHVFAQPQGFQHFIDMMPGTRQTSGLEIVQHIANKHLLLTGKRQKNRRHLVILPNLNVLIHVVQFYSGDYPIMLQHLKLKRRRDEHIKIFHVQPPANRITQLQSMI
ncbi:hypothetical protein D3C73_1360070 [compost metagenome]